MVKALHRAGIEVILDVVYNHTAEGNHLGPMLSFRGIDNRRLLPARCPTTRASTWTSRAPATRLNPVHPSVLRLIMDSLRYWVHRVPRRRLPLRPRLGARARVLRRRPPLGVLRRDPPGPGALAGEADRRAVGRRPGRLPGRQLPGALGGVERDRTATRCATSGAARRNVGDVRVALHGLERPLRGRRPPPVRLDQLRHRPRRLHARRPRLLQRTSTTRRTSRTTATAPTTTARGTAASRGRPTTRTCSRCARASSGTSSRRCSSRRACRCCSAATSSGARRAATTTRGARTTRSRGSTGTRRAGERAARVHAPAARAAARAPGVPADAVPRAARPARAGCPTPGGSGPTGGG